MPFTFKGQLVGKKTGEYQGKKRCHLQFMESKADGSVTFVEIKMPDNAEHSQYQQGKTYEVPVEYAIVQGDIYWKVSTTTAGSTEPPQRP